MTHSVGSSYACEGDTVQLMLSIRRVWSWALRPPLMLRSDRDPGTQSVARDLLRVGEVAAPSAAPLTGCSAPSPLGPCRAGGGSPRGDPPPPRQGAGAPAGPPRGEADAPGGPPGGPRGRVPTHAARMRAGEWAAPVPPPGRTGGASPAPRPAPSDPRGEGSKNVQKLHIFPPLRCRVGGEWGGSAHYPDPTAQSAPAPRELAAPGQVRRQGVGRGASGPTV